jgi:mannitol/fructose-specific phosphotransferase system IIA component (Ntr-type)
MNRRLSEGIDFEKMPDGSVKVEVICRKKHQNHIIEAVQTMAQNCQEDAFSILDRIRELEDQEQAEIVEEETVEVSMSMKIKRRKS